MLSKCHDLRNLGEYEGDLNIDDRIVTDLIVACRAVAGMINSLAPISNEQASGIDDVAVP